jgi:hypothetical protein
MKLKHALTLLALSSTAHGQLAVMHTNGVVVSPANVSVLRTSIGVPSTFGTGDSSVIGGGFNNTATAIGSVVAGGFGNDATNSWGAVVGGVNNDGHGYIGFLGGGERNRTEGGWSVVAGGFTNVASGGWSAILGGQINVASGLVSTVLGGERNTASGGNSTAAGSYAEAANQGAFVYSDTSSTNSFSSTNDNSFNIRANGGLSLDLGTNGIAFRNTTNAAVTRTNLGLGGGVTTNISIVGTNNTNTLVFSNGILTSVQ